MTKPLIIGHFDPLTTTAHSYVEFLNQQHDYPDILLLSNSMRINGIQNLYAIKNTFVKNQVYWRDCLENITTPYVYETIDRTIGKTYDKIFDLDTGLDFEPSPVSKTLIYQDLNGFWNQISREYQKLLCRRIAVVNNQDLVDTLFYEYCPYVDFTRMSSEQKMYFQYNNYNNAVTYYNLDTQLSSRYIADLYILVDQDNEDYLKLKNNLSDQNRNFITVDTRNMDLMTCVQTIKSRVKILSRELRW